jgi:hypothetical protein
LYIILLCSLCIKQLNSLTLLPEKCRVRNEGPDLKAENVTMCGLARAFAPLEQTPDRKYCKVFKDEDKFNPEVEQSIKRVKLSP